MKINVYNSYTGARRESECHFGSGDAHTQSINDEAELQEQPRADDIDEEERDDPLDLEKSRPLFLTYCRYVDKIFIEMLFE